MILLGKPLLEYTTSTNGVPDDTGWTVLDTPKDGTTSINTTEGTDVEALEEGGEVVDRIAQSSKYGVAFELYKKMGMAFPLADNEFSGVVSGEYALRVRSAVNDEAPGFQLDRCTVKTARQYASGDGYRKAYTFSGLKPNSGDTVKDIEGHALSFTKAADTTGKTVTAIEEGMVVTIPTEASWITSATFGTGASAKTLTVKVGANSESSAPAREATIICRGKSNMMLVKVHQDANV